MTGMMMLSSRIGFEAVPDTTHRPAKEVHLDRNASELKNTLDQRTHTSKSNLLET